MISKQNKLFVWLLFVVVTTLPLIVRYLNGAAITPLDSSYVHLINNNSLYDSVLHYVTTPLLPVILGLISFYLLTQLVKGYALVLFTITPLVMTTFVTHSAAALFFPVALGAYFLYRTNKYFSLLAIPLLVFTDAYAAVAFILFVMVYSMRQRLVILLTLVTLAISFTVSIKTGLGIAAFTYVPLFGEFGSAFGYSIFILLLGFVFIVQRWRTIDASQIFLWLFAFIVSGYLVTLRPLVLLPLVLYAAKALTELNIKKWHLAPLKQASFLLLLCLGMFVLIMHLKFLIVATPQPQFSDLFVYADADPRAGAILTSAEYEEFAKYSSTREVVVLSNEDIFWDAATIIEAQAFIQENNIRFIAITPQMTHGVVWKRDEGFRFLMLNSEKFINVRNNEGYELWLVLQEFI